MTNVCGIRMRYEQNVNKSTLHSLLVLTPECQIKILEENLKFLFQEDSSYNYFQIKSNHLSLRSESRDSIVQSANSSITEPKPLFISSLEPTLRYKVNKKEIPIERNKSIGLAETVNNSLSDRKELLSVHTSRLSSNILKETKRVKNKRVLSSAAKHSPLKPFFDQNGCDDHDNSRKDADNQYEFTVEQEKIVSFVCSNSPPRKQTDKSSSEYSDDQNVLSDHDSDSRCKLWTSCNGESDSLSESASNTCESNKTNTVVDTNYFSKIQQMTGSNKLLWHPPPSLSYDSLDTPRYKQPAYPAAFTNLNATDAVSDIRVSSDSVQRKMESSFSRETTLFRETSLRGCYNMENIVNGIIPPLTQVQQELKQVRESIFSAVRSQQSADDLVSDSILSILDICKSWLRLSSHLKSKEFVDILESNGINLSILNDFLQWQCVSRVFIDKMIDTLQKITPKTYGSNVSRTLNEHGSMTPTDVKNFAYSPGLLNMHNSVSSINTSCQSENDLLSSKCELSSNKHWKLRRFVLDQPNMESKPKSSCRSNCAASNTYNNFSQTHSPCSSDMFYGQGDPPLSYNSESHFCKINHPFPVKNNFSGQGDVNFSQNSCSILHGSVSNSYQPEKNTNLPCISKNSKHLVRERVDTKSYQPTIANNMVKDFPTLGLPINPHGQATTPNFAIVPPFYNSQMCYKSSSNYQLNPSQFTAKQNPIQCTDSDIVEKCTKSSYMKPGSYNIPEKPIGFQKIINNNIPIEDSPVVGVPFLFTGVQGNILSPKTLSSMSTTEKHMSIEDDGVGKSDEKWKAAMTSAEIFRDNLITCKADCGPNLKLSDTVSLKTHFLLSDDNSQDSSSNDFKLSSESEELSPCERTSPAMDVSVVEAQVKTSDWLMQSFNKAVLENEREVPNYMDCKKLNHDNISDFEVTDLYGTNLMRDKLGSKEKDGISSHYNVSCCISSSQNYFQFGPNEKSVSLKPELNAINAVDRKPESSDASLTVKRLHRNNRKLQDDVSISCLFDQRSSLFRRKAKSIFKRAITKPISSKLEDILNCICSTEVSSLVEFDCKSEKVRLNSTLSCKYSFQIRFSIGFPVYYTLTH